jgi:hypothetical protein
LLGGYFKEGYELADVMTSCRQTVEEEFRDGTEVTFSRILPVVLVQCAIDETIYDGAWLSGGWWTVNVFIHFFLEGFCSDVAVGFYCF